jgi:uncharacterized membrane protein YpjA
MHLGPRLRSFLFWAIFAGNLLGALYGFLFFYWQQLLATPLPFIIFIPDCPLFALLFAISMLLVRYAPGRFGLFNFLTFAGMLKYGFWTVWVLTIYRPFYASTPDAAFMSTLLLAGHVLLFFEAFLLASLVRVQPIHVAPILGFMLLSDFMDYFAGLHPTMPSSSLPEMFVLTVAMSLVSVLGGYIILRRAERPLLPILSAAQN